MTYKHLMIDIETLSTKSNAVILSIAAVNFDLDTGLIGDNFYKKIDIQSCLDIGLHIDGDTLKWWLNQNTDTLKEAIAEAEHVGVVLVEFISFVKNLQQDKLCVWGNSARFDLGLLENTLNKSGFLLPWKHYNERDVRTLVALNSSIKKDMEFIGDAHNPLNDCFHQIKYCSKTWNSLKPKQ